MSTTSSCTPSIEVYSWSTPSISASLMALPGIEDSQCGFKMFTAAAVRTIFPLVTIDGWAFDVEVLTIARVQGLRVIEVPIEWHYRNESQVSMLRDGVGMLRELLRIRTRAFRGAYRRRAAAPSDVR